MGHSLEQLFLSRLSTLKHIWRFPLTPWVVSAALSLHMQTHSGSAKPRMKSLGLLYFCQVNKSWCFGCSLTLVCHLSARPAPPSCRDYCNPTVWELRTRLFLIQLAIEGIETERGSTVWCANCASQLDMNYVFSISMRSGNLNNAVGVWNFKRWTSAQMSGGTDLIPPTDMTTAVQGS